MRDKEMWSHKHHVLLFAHFLFDNKQLTQAAAAAHASCHGLAAVSFEYKTL